MGYSKLKNLRTTIACFAAAITLVGYSAVVRAQEPPPAPITVHTTTGERSGAAAAALVARAGERGRLRVIVGLNERLSEEHTLAPSQATAQRARLRARQQEVVDAMTGTGADGVTLFETIPFLALNADAAAMRRLLGDPRVTSVQEDVPVPPTLLQSVPLIKADQASAQGYGGTGYVVAILDTGVAKSHPMFAGGKIASEACYSSTVPGQSRSLCPGGASSSTAAGSGVNCALSLDGCYHGTHVASIAVGSTGSLKGVARGARAIAIQVFSRFDSASFCGASAPCVLSWTSDQVKGLERVYALRTKFKIASANMSLGGGSYTAACDSQDPARSAIINTLHAAKIATVISSGNNGFTGSIGSPACIAKAIAVGSTTKTDGVSSFSNHGRLVDLMAPGDRINAAYPGGSFATLSGTSMAAPHVAGAIAILKQGKPAAGVKEIQDALSCTGKTVTRAGVAKPRIDVLAALNVVRSPATGCR